MKNFQECPFIIDSINVRSIYRSLSPGNFFMTFEYDNETSKPILIDTPYNPFNEHICACSTVWNPDFDQMKTLLFLGVKVNEPLTDDRRNELLEKQDDIVVFGSYDFSEDCKYSANKGEHTFKSKTYKFIIDNINKSIKIIHGQH